MKRHYILVVLIISGSLCIIERADAQGSDSWQVKASSQAEVIIADEVVRSDHPSQLFGFNINFRQFQEQIWTDNQEPKDGVIEALKHFEGALFRYPGGSVSNAFHWREAIGPVSERDPQSSFYQKNPAKVTFGIEEYLNFVDAVGGSPFYVLNLVGLDLLSGEKLSDVAAMAESNLELVKHLVTSVDEKHLPLTLQLGNELDRSRFEWSAEQYATRAGKVIEEIQKNELAEKVTFVNFMRDFTWTYRDKSRGRSSSTDYLEGVVEGLGVTNDYSLHHYYDGDREDGNSRALPFWLKFLARSISDHKKLTGESARIWITEHGRQPRSRSPGSDGSEMSTSNMAAALSSADYLISLAQFAEVQGAVWHGLNAGPWQLFDYSVRHKDLRPRPIYWAFRVLRMLSLDESLRTFTSSPNKSEYAGGYDVRAAAFRSSDGSDVGVRVVNRAEQTQSVRVRYDPFANKQVSYQHYSLSLPDNIDPDAEHDDFLVELDPESIEGAFDDDGYITLELPASSVSAILLQAAQ